MVNSFSFHGGAVLDAARATGHSPDSLIDFSSNADSLVNDLTEHLVRSIPYPYAYYPDDGCRELAAALAAFHHVDSQDVLVGNGSSELIVLCLQALRPGKVVIVGPVFSEYARACLSLGIDHELYLTDEHQGFALTPYDMEQINAISGDMLILCTPNNPTTAVYNDLAALLGGGQRTHILIDNTYSEFLYGTPAYEEHSIKRYRSLAQAGTSVLSLQSFTKVYYCTGIRLGYLVAPQEIVDTLKAVRAPWMVSRFAELAGLAFLAHTDAFRKERQALPHLREHFVAGLKQTGLFADILSSEVNFVLTKLEDGLEVEHLQTYLLEQGMLIRSCDNIPGMPKGYVRLQVRREEENAALLKACTGYARNI